MATSIPVLELSLKSSGSMSSYQYRAVLASTANADNGATVVASRGGKWTGVWQGNSTETTFDRVQVLGVAKVCAGDSSSTDTAITQGSMVVCSSVGQAVPSTAAGLFYLGIALGSLSTGSTGIIPVLLTPGAIST